MVGAPQQRLPRTERHADAVAERRRRPFDPIDSSDGIPQRLPREPSEREDRPCLAEEAQLPFEIGGAVRPFYRQGLVPGRSAAHCRREVQVGVPEAVGAPERRRLVRKPGEMEGAHEERRRPIAREDPARPVGAVSRGGEPDHHQARRRIAEPWDPSAPVLFRAELSLLLPGDLGTVCREPRAASAFDDLGAHPVEAVGHAPGERRVDNGSAGG